MATPVACPTLLAAMMSARTAPALARWRWDRVSRAEWSSGRRSRAPARQPEAHGNGHATCQKQGGAEPKSAAAWETHGEILRTASVVSSGATGCHAAGRRAAFCLTPRLPGKDNRRHDNHTALRQLDFRGHKDELILSLGRRRQLDLLDPPAVMLQGTLEGRLAGDVADQTDLRRIKTARHLDFRPFGLGQHRLQHQMLLDRRLALPVNVAHGSADVCVWIGLNVLKQKVEQP